MTREERDLLASSDNLLSVHVNCIRSRPHVYINSNNNDVTFQIGSNHYRSACNIVNAYPDIVIKRYSNNGQIVDADDEYLSTSEWRCTNRRTNPITDFSE